MQTFQLLHKRLKERGETSLAVYNADVASYVRRSLPNLTVCFPVDDEDNKNECISFCHSCRILSSIITSILLVKGFYA